MAVKDVNEKLKALAIPASKQALDEAQWRRDNRDWLRKSFEISVHILAAIKARGWNQKQLAEAMGVSQQQVSKIVQGKENLTLQTIATLEKILERKLIETHSGANEHTRAQKASGLKAGKGTTNRIGLKDKQGQTAANKPVKKYAASRGASKVAEPGKRK